MIHEVALGERRIDLLFVYPSDIIGVEIKGPRDSLGDGRLAKQMREYSFWLPEVWLAIDEKWKDHDSVKYFDNLLIHENGVVKRGRHSDKPVRDEMCSSRLLDLLWNDEVKAMGNASRVIAYSGRMNSRQALQVKGSMARLLTGQEIFRGVCEQLRARPSHMVGMASSPPIRVSGNIPKKILDSPRLV